MSTRQIIYDAAHDFVHQLAGETPHNGLILDGRWHYADHDQKHGYIGHWWHDDHKNERLKLTFNSFKHGGFTQRFDDWAVITAHREARAYKPRYSLPKGSTAKKDTKKSTVDADLKMWDSAGECGVSAYLERKNLAGYQDDSLRHNGVWLLALLVGFTDDGKLEPRGVQKIHNRGGNKLFSTGLTKNGAFITLGRQRHSVTGELAPIGVVRENRRDGTWMEGGRVWLCEGLATGATIHLATGEQVICALDAGNLYNVGRALSQHVPNLEIIYAGDSDIHKPAVGNVGAMAANAAALKLRARVALPDFTGCDLSSKPTDFNDLHSLKGLEAVKTQLAAHKLPDVTLAFAKERAKMLKTLKDEGASFERYLSELGDFKDGVTCIQSPQGTGKTQAMQDVVTNALDQGARVLYISHRTVLAANASNRLGLEVYSDYNAFDLRLMRGLSICVNSLHKLLEADETLSAFDIVIIDESEQFARALTGSHIKNKRANLTALAAILGRSRKLLCLDADLGPLTYKMLNIYRPNERYNRITNYYPVGEGQTVYVYSNANQVKKLASQPHSFIATNTLRDSGMGYYLQQKQNLSGTIINSETSHDLQGYIADINERSQADQFTATSPSLSTGVSIDHDGYARVCGLFDASIGTSHDAVQSLWRVRNVPERHIWLDPRGNHEHIDVDARYGASLTHEEALQGRELGSKDDGYNSLVQAVRKHEQWQRANYKYEVLRLLAMQGFEVVLHEQPKLEESEALSQLGKMISKAENKAYINHRVQASQLSEHDAKVLEAKQGLTAAEHYQLARYRVTSFYKLAPHEQDPETLTEWLKRDKRGRYRYQIQTLEQALASDIGKLTDEVLARVDMRADMPLIAGRRLFYQQVLEATYVVDTAQALQAHRANPKTQQRVAKLERKLAQAEHDLEAINAKVEQAGIMASLRMNTKGGPVDQATQKVANLRDQIEQTLTLPSDQRRRYTPDSLESLRQWIEDNRAWLSGLISLPTPNKLQANIMRYVGTWLGKLALSQERIGKNGSRQYALKLETLETTCKTLERRGTLLLTKDNLHKSVPPVEAVEVKASPPPKTPPDWLEIFKRALNSGKFAGIKPDYIQKIRSWISTGNTIMLERAYKAAPTDVQAVLT